jgi:hypothetical protein
MVIGHQPRGNERYFQSRKSLSAVAVLAFETRLPCAVGIKQFRLDFSKNDQDPTTCPTVEDTRRTGLGIERISKRCWLVSSQMFGKVDAPAELQARPRRAE